VVKPEAEAGLDLPALELQQVREWKRVELGRGWAAGAAEEVGTVAFACLHAGVEGGK
jgi:hypothetical protein